MALRITARARPPLHHCPLIRRHLKSELAAPRAIRHTAQTDGAPAQKTLHGSAHAAEGAGLPPGASAGPPPAPPYSGAVQARPLRRGLALLVRADLQATKGGDAAGGRRRRRRQTAQQEWARGGAGARGGRARGARTSKCLQRFSGCCILYLHLAGGRQGVQRVAYARSKRAGRQRARASERRARLERTPCTPCAA